MKKITHLFLMMLGIVALSSCNSDFSSSNDGQSLTDSSTSVETSETTSAGSDETSSSSTTIEYQRTSYSNPLNFYKLNGEKYFVTAADPFVLRGDDGYWYLYITNAQCEMGTKGMIFDRGPIFRSKNLVDWRWYSSVFENSPDAANWGNSEAGVWGPTVIKINDNQYNYYYSLSSWGDSNPGIGVATSPTPYGPWTHYGKLLDQQMSGVVNGIDPFVTFDDEGQLWIIWGSFNGIAATLLTDDGTELFYGNLVKDHLVWLVENNQKEGKGFDININYEGAFVLKKDDEYFFMGSQGTCLAGSNSTYTVRVGKSSSLFGPYLGKDGQDMNHGTEGEVVVQPSDAVAGTGHNAVIQDYAGDYWLIYHGFDNFGSDSQERSLFMDKILWDAQGYPYILNRNASVRINNEGPLTIK